MKVRREPRGLHFYERQNGLHVLFDECPIPTHECDEGPAVTSIALTNICDLSCPFCYAPKSRHTLSTDEVVGWCKELAALGTLEVAVGGGEPTLYPNLPELCRTIWSETNMGVSITTHGQHLGNELVNALAGSVSLIRISIDAPEPHYSLIRRRPLQIAVENVRRLAGRIPFAVNTVINRATLPYLDELAILVRELAAVDWLLLPEVRSGEFTLTDLEWQALDRWISEHRFDFELRTAAEAAGHLSGPFLFENMSEDYAHISADGYLRRRSYANGGVPLRGNTVLNALRELRRDQRVAQTCFEGLRFVPH